MAGQMSAAIALLLLTAGAVADHPCTEEVASACADRPGSDVGACLKDPEEHDYPTEISSGCTDFIALNKACEEDLETHCEGNHFSDDTLLCLTKWTPLDHLSEQCQKVVGWAAPKEAEGDEKVVTDELGLSDKDYEEKKEWMRKRKEARGDSIERMKMKETDKKAEEDRVSLEEYKRADPEGYASMIQQQDEEKRQQANFKKQERARAAALARKKKKDAGGDDEEAETQKGKASAGSGGAKKAKSSWLYTIMSFVVIGGLGFFIYSFVSSQDGKANGKNNQKAGKKKRG